MLRKWDKIKLIGVVISLFLIFGGCGAGKVTTNPDWLNTDNDLITVEVFEKNLNKSQMDSLCVCDTIERDYMKWTRSIYGPDNNGIIHVRYINSDTTGLMKTYILELNSDSTYNVIKRIRKRK